MSVIYGNTVGGGFTPKVFQLETEDGVVLEGVVTEEAPILTATANDVRKGKTVITNQGLITGEKDIPSYHTSEGKKIIPIGSNFKIELPILNQYDYTALQCVICPYNESISRSVAAEKVVLDNNVYPVQSTISESTVIKDDTNKSIMLGITNNTDNIYILRYFTYKED